MPSANNDQVSGALWLILGLGIILASIPYGLGALASPGTAFLPFLSLKLSWIGFLLDFLPE